MLIIGLVLSSNAIAGDFSRLWLRFEPFGNQQEATIGVAGDTLVEADQRMVLLTAERELRKHWTGAPVLLQLDGTAAVNAGMTPASAVDAFSVEKSAQGYIRILSATACGLLYGAFFILRSQVMGDQCLCSTLGSENRTVQQADAPLRTVAAGRRVLAALASDSARLLLFARANAAVGINTVAVYDSKGRPQRVKAALRQRLEDVLRPYAITLADSMTMPQSLGSTAWCVVTANVFTDRLAQWDWYRAARLQWQGDLEARRIAHEWLAQTYSENPLFVMLLCDLMASPKTSRSDLHLQLRDADERFFGSHAF